MIIVVVVIAATLPPVYQWSIVRWWVEHWAPE